MSKTACLFVLGYRRSTLPLVTVSALGQNLKKRACVIHDFQDLLIKDLSVGSHK